MKFFTIFCIGILINPFCVTAMEEPNKATLELYTNYNQLDEGGVTNYIQAGANINYRPNKDYALTLLMKSIDKSVPHTQLLLKNDANCNASLRGQNQTALDLALLFEKKDHIKVLLDANPEKIATDYAIRLRNKEIIKLFLEKEDYPIAILRTAMKSSDFIVTQLYIESGKYDKKVVGDA